MIGCLCVRVGMCCAMRASSCTPVHASPSAHSVRDMAHAKTRVRRRWRKRRRVGRRGRRSRRRRRRRCVGRRRRRSASASSLVYVAAPRAPHHSASRSADRPQSRRRCAPVSEQPQPGPPVQMWTSIGAVPARSPGQMSKSSVTLCVRAHDCVPVRARGHVPWYVCVIEHACACVPVGPHRA